jgi:hypothetical protein
MKKTLSSILCLLFLVSCSSQLKYLNTYYGLNGKPKKVEMRIFRMKHSDSITTEKLEIKLVDYYDSNGRKQKMLKYKPDSLKPHASKTYNYDTYGNLTKIVSYNAYDSMISQITHHYNKFGIKTKTDKIGGPNAAINNLTSITNSNKKTITFFDSITNSRVFKKYDNKWREIEITVYDSLGNKTSNISYEYDNKNNRIKTVFFDAKKKRYRISETIFNTNNHPVFTKSKRIKENDTLFGKTSKFEYLYDYKNNKIIEKVYGNNDKPTFVIKYKYDYY